MGAQSILKGADEGTDSGCLETDARGVWESKLRLVEVCGCLDVGGVGHEGGLGWQLFRMERMRVGRSGRARIRQSLIGWRLLPCLGEPWFRVWVCWRLLLPLSALDGKIRRWTESHPSFLTAVFRLLHMEDESQPEYDEEQPRLPWYRNLTNDHPFRLYKKFAVRATTSFTRYLC